MNALRAAALGLGLWCLVSMIPVLGPAMSAETASWLGPAAVQAASPAPSPDTTGDTRSAGEGPGLVGAPLLAIGGVLGLGLLAALATIAYVRLTGGGSGARVTSGTGETIGAATPERQP